MTPARFRWGLILIQIGVLLLLRNMNVINDSFWEELIIYFPLVIIAVGVEKIFTKSKLQFISYLTSVAIFFGGFAIALTVGQSSFDGNFFSESDFDLEKRDGVEFTHAVLNLDRTDLTVRDAGKELIRGRFDRFTRKPEIDYTVEGNMANISFRSRKHSYLGGVVRIETDEPQDWFISFAEDIPLDLECYGQESDIHLNLTTTPLSKLKLDASKSKIYLRLGDLVKAVQVSVLGEDSNLRLRIPFDVGIRIDGDSYGPYLKEIGFAPKDGGFVNDAYLDADAKIDVDLDDRLSSLSIDFF